jgi:hypothetical protein
VVEFSEGLREDLKIGVLRSIVDKVCAAIIDGKLDREEAEREIANVRKKASLLIPDMMATYDLIYASRFKRLVEQFIVDGTRKSHHIND